MCIHVYNQLCSSIIRGEIEKKIKKINQTTTTTTKTNLLIVSIRINIRKSSCYAQNGELNL